MSCHGFLLLPMQAAQSRNLASKRGKRMHGARHAALVQIPCSVSLSIRLRAEAHLHSLQWTELLSSRMTLAQPAKRRWMCGQGRRGERIARCDACVRPSGDRNAMAAEQINGSFA